MQILRSGRISEAQYEAYIQTITFLTDPVEDLDHICNAADWEEEERQKHTQRLIIDPAYFFFGNPDVFSSCVSFLLESYSCMF